MNLQKGGKINLEKDGTELTEITLGLGWDPAGSVLSNLFGSGGGDIDLDASCVMLDDSKGVVDRISFRKKQSDDGSVKHTGDNLTGAGSGDDEQIKINLSKVNARVKRIVFAITSYRGQTFDKVKNCYARVIDPTNKEFVRYNLDEKGNNTAQIMAQVYRHEGKWKFGALGIPANGRTIEDIVDIIKQSV